MSGEEEEKMLLKFYLEFNASWNKGDHKRLSEMFTLDACRVSSNGETQNGSLEIMSFYENLFSRALPGAMLKMEKPDVRLIAPEFAVLKSGFEIVLKNNAKKLSGFFLFIMQKKEGKWLILECNPKLFCDPV
jgi:uncharacterized protein (TIGR02246 family)